MLENPKFEASYCRLFFTDIVGIMGEDPAIDAFFVQFYKRFLRDESVAKLFANTDMDHQIGMLKHSLFQLTSCCVLGKPSAELVRLAEVHRKLGISPEFLDKWLEALLDTIAIADPEYDEATRLAWCWALAPGIFYLKSVMREDSGAEEVYEGINVAPVWRSGAMDRAGPGISDH